MTLDRALATAAASRVLLVACDYDGTLAPIVDDPSRAVPDPDALAALIRIAALRRTEAAILSGRALDELKQLTGAPRHVRLIGSHGAESGPEGTQVDPSTRVRLAEAAQGFVDLARRIHGAHVEQKPAGVAFHYRTVPPSLQRQAAIRAEEVAADFPEFRVLHGKRVVEVAASGMDKGAALIGLREATEADVVVFLGDDVTDEDAFLVLGPGDVAVKVGQGETAASHRIDDQESVARVLDEISGWRAASV